MDLRRRLSRLDSIDLAGALDDTGFAELPKILTAAECRLLVSLYDDEARFRSRVVMERHRFGQGEYKYFRSPLPEIVATLRETLYERLLPIANHWRARLGEPAFPPTLRGLAARCRAHGQKKPTPLLLRYEAGGYNRLHQDLYGDVVFPLQVAFLLSRPGRDFTGGENVFTEQSPRMQSRAHVVSLGRGEGVVFACAERPVQGARGVYRARFRHGIATLRSGHRVTLGIIFHDAR